MGPFETKEVAVEQLDRSRPDWHHHAYCRHRPEVDSHSEAAELRAHRADDSRGGGWSRETGRYIVFVHPAEFLVTAPDGSVVDVQLFGDPREGDAALAIEESEIGTARDRNEVCYVDLPGVPSSEIEGPTERLDRFDRIFPKPAI